MTSVALDIAQKTLPDLIEDVLLGSHVLITRDKTPVAEIIPIPGVKHKPVFGSAKGMITMAADFDATLPDFAEYSK